jgi:hypothetical protein
MEDVKHSLQETIKHLEERHKELEYNIAWGYSNYLHDADMGKMKKEKLMIKDQIENLKASL